MSEYEMPNKLRGKEGESAAGAIRTVRTPSRARLFLEALSSGHAVASAADAAGISRRAAYDWRDADEAFASAWADAVDAGTDRIEQEAFRRAVEGVERPVFQGGAMVGTTREYSDRLIERLLVARRPSVWNPRQQVEMTGQVAVEQIDWAAKLAAAREAASAPAAVVEKVIATAPESAPVPEQSGPTVPASRPSPPRDSLAGFRGQVEGQDGFEPEPDDYGAY